MDEYKIFQPTISNVKAARTGIDERATVREEVILRRDRLKEAAVPDWETIVLFSHIIWWLAE